MQEYLDRLTDKKATDLVDKVGAYFKSLPALPIGLLEFLVKIAPYLALLSAIFTIIGGPLVGLLGTLASIVSLSPLFLVWTVLTVILMIAQAILMLMAFTPLKQRLAKGWMLLFWAEVLGVAQTVVTLLNGSVSSVVMHLIFTLVWFYILFQMRSLYTGAKKA